MNELVFYAMVMGKINDQKHASLGTWLINRWAYTEFTSITAYTL